MSVALLSLVLACRFFGLFVVMPLLALYVLSFEDCTPLLLGLSMGIYALSQMLFQIPFGSLSDKYGRKPLIALGIVIFIIGSLVCAFAQSAQMLVFGRFLQGVGAIGGVVSAMIADVVPETRRTKAMATMGASISLSFALAMIIGSIEKDASTLFALACVLSALSLLLLFFVPDVARVQFSYSQKATDGMNKNLWIMNMSNFLQKMFMTLAFVTIPLLLSQNGIAKESMWQFYIPAALLGVLAMAPAAILAEKRGKFKLVLAIGIALFVLAYLCLLLFSAHLAMLAIGGVLFFVGFCFHEPILQSLASRYCKAHQKGRALGIFTSCGYIGSFFGGLIGSVALSSLSPTAFFGVILAVCAAWLLVLRFLDSPTKLGVFYHAFGDEADLARLSALQALAGVSEYYINHTEKQVVIRYNAALVTEQTIAESLK